MQDKQWLFWVALAGKVGSYNDLQFAVLRYNGYVGSNADMLAQWRKAGYPTLIAVGA